MERKAIVIIGIVATIVALVIFSGAAYAAGGQSFGQGTRYGGMMGHSGSAGSMMGRAAGYPSGMMGGCGGMMGDFGASNWCASCMARCMNSTSLP